MRMDGMLLRAYRPEDCPALAQLFYDTVHAVNARDYTPAQLNAWATGTVDLCAWNASFLAHRTLVAQLEGQIAGFGDIDVSSGYLDRLYVHRDFQGRAWRPRFATRWKARCPCRSCIRTLPSRQSPFSSGVGIAWCASSAWSGMA